MLRSDSLKSSSRAAGTKECEIVVSLRGQWRAIPLTHVVDDRNLLCCSMPGRELLLINEAQLAEYLRGLANSLLVWDAGI